MTALMRATYRGHLECVRELLDAGAIPETMGSKSIDIVQLLCSYGANRNRAPLVNNTGVHEFYRQSAWECHVWMRSTVRWVSQLHHFEFMPTTRVRKLLRSGADLHANDGGVDAPTPLSLAWAMNHHECAQLVISAANPWSMHTHELFPLEARKRAAELLVIGQLLAKQPMFTGQAMAWIDLWTTHVMAYAVTR
jgi:ankyrin repeat protein